MKKDKRNSYSLKKLNKNRKTIGIDQSLTGTGVVIINRNGDIVEAKRIETTNKITSEERLLYIVKNIEELIEEYNIKQATLEGVSFYSSNTTSLSQLSGLYFLLTTTFLTKKIDFLVVEPRLLKKGITGSGNAKKEEMVNAISLKEKLILEKKSGVKHTIKKFHDIADAYHLAKFHFSL